MALALLSPTKADFRHVLETAVIVAVAVATPVETTARVARDGAPAAVATVTIATGVSRAVFQEYT